MQKKKISEIMQNNGNTMMLTQFGIGIGIGTLVLRSERRIGRGKAMRPKKRQNNTREGGSVEEIRSPFK